MTDCERLVIPFKGISDGRHNFLFFISKKFFENIEYSEIKNGNLSVNIGMNKNPQYLLFEIKISGKVEVICDRCLDYFYMLVDYSGKLYGKFVNERKELEEDCIALLPFDEMADLTHYIYESIILSLPSQRFHPIDKNGKSSCNKFMINKLKKLSKTGSVKNENDPRWNKLKELYN